MWLTGDERADALLASDDNALLVGMCLDQQITLEKAFSGPRTIADRMGGTFDVAAIAALPVDDFVTICAAKPAVHRFPANMGKRVHALCTILVEDYDGDAGNVWNEGDARAVLARLEALPSFGPQKAKIFLALLGKQRGLTAPGWREAAGEFGGEGYRSVADITSPESLAEVRAHKKAMKVAAKAQ